MNRVLVSVLALGVVGCGSTGECAVDAAVVVDAWANDAALPDGDGDGVPTATDCDDTDATVGVDSSRSCANACGEGSETCSRGVWAACSAPTECLCETEGAHRVGACGFCGQQSEECTDGVWTAASECLNSGCEPGTVEVEALPRCGEQQRICDDACQWGEWVLTMPQGECNAGEVSDCIVHGAMCNEMCQWVRLPECG